MTTDEGDRRGGRDIAGCARRLGEVKVRISDGRRSAGSAGMGVGSRRAGPLMWAALFCAAATACASTGDSVGKVERKDDLEQLAGAAQLTNVEIRNLLVGRALSHDIDRAIKGGSLAITTFYRESYRKDGTVAVTSHQAGMAGRYDITDNRLCLDLNHRRWCRRIFRSPDGALWQRDDITGERTAILVSAPTGSAAVLTEEPLQKYAALWTSSHRVQQAKSGDAEANARIHPPPSGFSPLSGRELRRLIVGNSVEPSNWLPNSRRPQLKEFFLLHGRYRATSRRAVEYRGTYRFRGNEVCVTERRIINYCYSVLVDRKGRFYRHFRGFDTLPEMISVLPIRIGN